MDSESILNSTQEQDKNRIYKIDLPNKGIMKIASLKQYEKLRCLMLNFNSIEVIENLRNLNDLRELHLQYNNILKIEGLQGNKNLQVLNLANNRIEKIQNISHLIKLETLILDENKISKLSGLEYLKQLKILSVGKNQLQSIESMPSFSKLQNLLLSKNKIKSISNNLFASSNQLVNIDLSFNLLANTTFLQQLSSLEILNLKNNQIKQLTVPAIMPNLQLLNISDNQIQSLPLIKSIFPELITLDLSNNFICSEIEIIGAIAEASSLTQIDFRGNPMYSESFQSAIQKIHCFDFLNGKVMSKAGSKYYGEIRKIQDELNENRQIYGEDDESERKIKFSGFFNSELEYQLTGLKPNRPNSPKKKTNLDKPTFFEDIQNSYNEFVKNDSRIKSIREQYLKICQRNNIISQNTDRINTEEQGELITLPEKMNKSQSQQFTKNQQEKSILKKLESQETQIRREHEKNLTKWKQLKQRQKSFNIRDAIKKSKGKDSLSRPSGSASNVVSTQLASTGATLRGQIKLKNDLFKTQIHSRKTGEFDLMKTMIRPSSTKKKQF